MLLALIEDGETPIEALNTLIDRIPYEASAANYWKILGGKRPLTADIVDPVRPKVHAALASAGDPYVLVKTHSAVSEHGGTETITLSLTAGAVYIIRDPRDVAISYASYFARSIDRAILEMGRSDAATDGRKGPAFTLMGAWSEHVESWTADPHPGLLIVRYEDMLSDTAAELKRIAQFLNQPTDRARIRRAVKATRFETLKAAEKRGRFRETATTADRFFRSGKAGEWRNVLTPEQAARIEADHGDVMRRFGYLE